MNDRSGVFGVYSDIKLQKNPRLVIVLHACMHNWFYLTSCICQLISVGIRGIREERERVLPFAVVSNNSLFSALSLFACLLHRDLPLATLTECLPWNQPSSLPPHIYGQDILFQIFATATNSLFQVSNSAIGDNDASTIVKDDRLASLQHESMRALKLENAILSSEPA